MKSENEMLLSKSDPILERIMLQVPKPQIETTNDVFHDLMSCVVEQQIHYRSTKKVFQKMLHSADVERLSPDNFRQFEERALSNIKLATSKYETIIGILALWEANKIDWQLLQDKEVVSILSTIKGIGKWTIDMILLYTLQRPNIFPYDDFHLKQIMVSLYKLDPKAKLKAQMIAIAENWGNQRSLAVLYLLAWKQYQKSL